MTEQYLVDKQSLITFATDDIREIDSIFYEAYENNFK